MIEESFKERIRKELIRSSKEYKEVYVDYEYLLCSEAFAEKQYYIVDAKENNFQHLTGVHSKLPSQIFFDKCLTGTLTEDDFDFIKKGQDEKAVKGTVRRKIIVLPDMMKLFKVGLLAEENFKKNKVLCSLAASDGSCTLGFSKSDKVRPKSLIRGNGLSNPKPVELIFRKKAGADFFDELIVGDEIILFKYRNQIQHLLANGLKQENKNK